MALQSGTRLGVCEISDLLGMGVMGEAYRARDTKLECDLAIDVVSAEFPQGTHAKAPSDNRHLGGS